MVRLSKSLDSPLNISDPDMNISYFRPPPFVGSPVLADDVLVTLYRQVVYQGCLAPALKHIYSNNRLHNDNAP